MFEESEPTLADDVGANHEVLARLSQDPDQLKLLVTAFRAQDHDTFRAVLSRLELNNHCEIVCDWLRAKHCVLRCIELCKPDIEPVDLDLAEWAQLVPKLTANTKLFAQLCDAFNERNRDGFMAALDELGMARYCRFVCYWICNTWCGLVCNRLCRPERPVSIVACRQLILELRQTTTAIERLASNRSALKSLNEAVRIRDCVIVRELLEQVGLAGHCQQICRWICSWRCVRVCFLLCKHSQIDVIRGELDEIQEFTSALANLSPDVLVALAETVENEDSEKFYSIIKQYGLDRFCHQICAWLCHLTCRRFCICVCRPARPRPWFTHVGHFHILGDIDSSTGLTNKSVFSHGGPGFGFHKCLELRGFCPAESPLAPGNPMRYRFVVERSGMRAPLLGSLLCPVNVGSRRIFWDINGTGLEETFQTITIAGAGATSPFTPVPSPLPPPGTPWGSPPAHVIVPDADGWIEVDTDALGSAFNGALIGFDSNARFPGGAAGASVAAGAQLPFADLRSGVDATIVFEATRVGGPTAPPDHSNALSRIHINNWGQVQLLDLLQFHTGGSTSCSELGDELDIEYSADHELMLQWSLGINSAALGSPLALLNGTATRSGAAHSVFGVHHIDISTWQPCSYTVTLSTQRALTDGLTDDLGSSLPVTFCKG